MELQDGENTPKSTLSDAHKVVGQSSLRSYSSSVDMNTDESETFRPPVENEVTNFKNFSVIHLYNMNRYKLKFLKKTHPGIIYLGGNSFIRRHILSKKEQKWGKVFLDTSFKNKDIKKKLVSLEGRIIACDCSLSPCYAERLNSLLEDMKGGLTETLSPGADVFQFIGQDANTFDPPNDVKHFTSPVILNVQGDHLVHSRGVVMKNV